jgi:hypothetical protein
MYSKYIFFNPVACCFLYKAKDLSAPPHIPVLLSHHSACTDVGSGNFDNDKHFGFLM